MELKFRANHRKCLVTNIAVAKRQVDIMMDCPAY
jgi:hypothetical protein